MSASALRIAAICLVCVCRSAQLTAQTDDQSVQVTRTADHLATVQTLPVGDTMVDVAPAEGLLYWVIPQETGLYRIAIDGPGAIKLSTFSTEDGRFDGETGEEVVATKAEAFGRPDIGPFLLAKDWPYLLSVDAIEPASLTLELLQTLPAAIAPPEKDTVLPEGAYLFTLSGDLRLSVADPDVPLSIMTLAEPRAVHRATASGRPINGTTEPYDPDQDFDLGLSTTAPEGQKTPLTFVRVAPFEGTLDETEPNHNLPDAMNITQGFAGSMLTGKDVDRIGFTLPSTQDLALEITTDVPWADFEINLLKTEDRQDISVLTRKSMGGAISPVPLRLDEGAYILQVTSNHLGEEPIDYRVTFAPSGPFAEGHEIEPNDGISSATPLSPTGTMRGTTAHNDIDYLSFEVDSPNRLWRVFGLKADRVILTGQSGTVADVQSFNGRAIIDSLALVPGRYTAEIRGSGDYAFRVMDLGARPARHEAEPNNRPIQAGLLSFGEAFTGSFSSPNDIDLFQFRLGAETVVDLSIVPSGDGPMTAQLYLDDRKWGNTRAFAAGDGTYAFTATLPAGDWFVHLGSKSSTTRETYSVQLVSSTDISEGPQDGTPATSRPIPLDGNADGVVGAFDAEDHWLVRLPAQPHAALVACGGASWSLWPWSGGKKFVNAGKGIVPLTAEMAENGAVRIVVAGGDAEEAYQCAVRFVPEPDQLQEPTAVAPIEELVLRSGDHVSGTLTAVDPRQSIALDIPDGSFGALACFSDEDTLFAPRDLRPRDLELVAAEDGAAFLGFRAGAEPVIEIRAPFGADENMPWRCALLGMQDLPRLSDMGALATLSMPVEVAPTVPQGGTGVSGTPPSLDALAALVPPASQLSGDLPVSIKIGDIPQIAAYADAGQKITLQAELTNTDEVAHELTLGADVAGDGWRTVVSQDQLALAPDETTTITVEVLAPPWASAALSPSLLLTAKSQMRFATQVGRLAVSATAPPQGSFVYYDAPEALRGGLNLLHYGLGTRLVEMEGTEIDVREADARAYLHDGLAPHAAVREVKRDLIFRLPDPAQIAGLMFQLRSTARVETFPTTYEVYASNDGQSWERAAEGRLDTTFTPQYAVLADSVTAQFVRFRFPDCPVRGCNPIAVQELQAIGPPGEHPAGWPPVNAADLNVGGHVLYAFPDLTGDWNATLLHPNPELTNTRWFPRNETQTAVIGFHQNRAALVDHIVWVGHPKDQLRAKETTVEVSMQGPAGPWTQIGILAPPPIGQERAELILPEPSWARYIRFTFQSFGENGVSGPDAIEVIEAPGTSVIGLWEDDRLEAAHEALQGGRLVTASEPAGGATREIAVPITPNQQVASAVLLERNEDWWHVTVPEGPLQEAHFEFGPAPVEIVAELMQADGTMVPLEQVTQGGLTRMTALLAPGSYDLRVYEPPRSVVIAWDTSGSVAPYIPRTLGAVRLWSESLVPGRDVLQLLPFAPRPSFLLDTWAQTPEDIAPVLRNIRPGNSSDSETALGYAAGALANRDGARGVVIITDGETTPSSELWANLLKSQPRIVALSIDSDGRQDAAIMMDWANLNGGRFQRVVGTVGLADGLDMAAALFRAPKSYELELSLTPFEEPEGEAVITLNLAEAEDGEAPVPAGAVEVILDASGSMLRRIEGERRIDIAHDALSQLVDNTLPEGMPFAFRAFGLEADACLTELRTPLGPLDRAAARQAIQAVPAINNARTAIADSLAAAADDLAQASEPRVIVLVTDGEETCEGDPLATIEMIRQSGFDVRVNIVGFAIDDAALAETFAGWAKAGNGAYFEAQNSDALNAAVDTALTPSFTLARHHIDGRIEPLGSLVPGQTITLPAGKIEISPEGIAAGEGMFVRLMPDDTVKLTYNPISGLQDE